MRRVSARPWAKSRPTSRRTPVRPRARAHLAASPRGRPAHWPHPRAYRSHERRGSVASRPLAPSEQRHCWSPSDVNCRKSRLEIGARAQHAFPAGDTCHDTRATRPSGLRAGHADRGPPPYLALCRSQEGGPRGRDGPLQSLPPLPSPGRNAPLLLRTAHSLKIAKSCEGAQHRTVFCSQHANV